jgi:hypothetical protein
MSEFDKLILSAAAAMIAIYLVGPSAIWRITKAAAEWSLVILVIIWAV